MSSKPNTIRRSLPEKEPYLAVSRAMLQDGKRNLGGLSFEARGLLGYLLSKPGDWVVTVQDIMAEGGIGRDKAKAILAELRSAGYVVTEMVKSGAGRFAGKIDYVYGTRHRSTEIPSNGFPVQRETRHIQNREKYTESENDSAAGADGGAKPKKERPRDALFDTIATVVFETSNVVGGAGARIAAVKKAILEVQPDATPDDVRQWRMWYRVRNPSTNTPRSTDKVALWWGAWLKDKAEREKRREQRANEWVEAEIERTR